MTKSHEPISQAVLHDKKNYQIDGLESEISADRLCAALLKAFHQHLLRKGKMEPLEAGSHAAGADYFLREFMIGKRRDNIFNGSAELVRQFAGHWYIISNLEPNISELSKMLKGTASFYQYCAEYQLIDAINAEQIRAACNQAEFYQQRIEDFHNISGAGINTWEQACPLD
jgi:hypothetical protein